VDLDTTLDQLKHHAMIVPLATFAPILEPHLKAHALQAFTLWQIQRKKLTDFS